MEWTINVFNKNLCQKYAEHTDMYNIFNIIKISDIDNLPINKFNNMFKEIVTINDLEFITYETNLHLY